MRNSKTYAGFKTFNSVLYIILGAAIVVQMVRLVGPRFEAIPGIVLGLAMFALGVHRALLVLRARR
jgi:hypothetical protein